MTIRQAFKEDLTAAKSLTETCALAMQEKGIYQWNEHYPSIEKLLNDIERKELYLLMENNLLLGMIVLTDFMDTEYDAISWLTKSKKNLYIHRLATHPAHWGNGYGQKLMEFAEEFAKTSGYLSIRLDTFSLNKRNQIFYEARDYKKLGDIYFPKQSEAPFHCYELVL